MTAQSICHTANEVVASQPIDMKRVLEHEHHALMNVSHTIYDKTTKPRYSEATISWEYFQNELEFE
jgi:hypothetical protein